MGGHFSDSCVDMSLVDGWMDGCTNIAVRIEIRYTVGPRCTWEGGYQYKCGINAGAEVGQRLMRRDNDWYGYAR